MYFYDYLLLLSNILMLAVYAQSNSTRGPGISSCSYYGNLKQDCNLSNINIADLPSACTALILDGFLVDLSYNVNTYNRSDKTIDTFEQLDKLLKSSKNVFVLYGHQTQEEWTQILACEDHNNGTNSKDEMKGLKAFMDQHPGIKGLLLTQLELDDKSTKFSKYSEGLKVYLDTMKSNFPDLAIGLYLSGKFIIDQYNKPKITWLNFTIIDPSVDFYSISVVTFNDCTKEFKSIGTAPIGSSNSSSLTNSQNLKNSSSLMNSPSSKNSSILMSPPSMKMSINTTNSSGLTKPERLKTPDTIYTLSNLKNILVKLSIPKTKTYYRYRLNPMTPDSSLPMCQSTISQVCLHPNDTSSWCSDTTESFNEKGQFAKQNGAGFIVNFIDLNDPHNDCKCGPYPTFNAILDGYKGKTTKQCAPLERS